MKKPDKRKKDTDHIKFKKEGDMPPAAISLANTLYNKTGKWRSIRPVVDYSKCTSCMICWSMKRVESFLLISSKENEN